MQISTKSGSHAIAPPVAFDAGELSLGGYVNLIGALGFDSLETALETIVKGVGHGNQFDVRMSGVTESLDGRPGPPSAATDQGQLDQVAAGGVDTPGDTE